MPPRGSNNNVLSQFLSTLTEFIVVSPEQYLPDQSEEADEYETSCALF